MPETVSPDLTRCTRSIGSGAGFDVSTLVGSGLTTGVDETTEGEVGATIGISRALSFCSPEVELVGDSPTDPRWAE